MATRETKVVKKKGQPVTVKTTRARAPRNEPAVESFQIPDNTPHRAKRKTSAQARPPEPRTARRRS